MTTTTPPPPDEPLPDPVPARRASGATGARDRTGSVRLRGKGAAERGVGIDPATRTGSPAVNRGWYALLLVPFVALLWLPFYARRTPELFGFPFFYWYQFAWVFLGAAITGLVYRLTTSRDTGSPKPAGNRSRGGSHRREGRS